MLGNSEFSQGSDLVGLCSYLIIGLDQHMSSTVCGVQRHGTCKFSISTPQTGCVILCEVPHWEMLGNSEFSQGSVRNAAALIPPGHGYLVGLCSYLIIGLDQHMSSTVCGVQRVILCEVPHWEMLGNSEFSQGSVRNAAA
jgi:hypothetical protein